METVTFTQEQHIGLIRIDNPPVNAASFSVRRGLADAISALENDGTVEAIAIYAEGRTFTAGADIKEFGKPPQAPSLSEVCIQIEQCSKPVVAVLHGFALGGGLEIAMSAHVRTALPGLRVGLPEVTLGIFPGAGGTQRAPRLIGIANAIDMIISGRMVALEQALEWGLVDYEASGTPKEVALEAGRKIIGGTLQPHRTGDLTVKPDPDAVEAARAKLAKKSPRLPAPEKALEAITVSSGPLEAGLATERALFSECLNSPERAGLVHAFFAERAVTNVPEADATPRAIETVGVIGGGTMGSGIATSLLLAKIPVTLIEMNTDQLDAARTTIENNLHGAVKRGKISTEDKQDILALLVLSTDLAKLTEVDLVIEAIFEDMDIKKQIFSKLDHICKPATVLATNTSYLNINEIAAATSRPADVIGLHFFSPAHVMKLLEIVVPDGADPAAVKTGFILGKRLKKVCVRSQVCDGFIGNRILSHYRKCADYLMLDGAPPEQIDHALEKFGFAMGPYAVSDLAGLDIGWATRKRLAATRHLDERYVGTADRICEHGWFGRKTGRGFYVYEDARRTPNPSIAEFISAEQSENNITPRDFADEEIVDRYMTAMISEAARVVEEGIALRPIDVDAVFLFGYGFPRHRGGPLHYADQIGAKELVRRINGYARDDRHYWRIPQIIQRMAEDGSTFSELND